MLLCVTRLESRFGALERARACREGDTYWIALPGAGELRCQGGTLAFFSPGAARGDFCELGEALNVLTETLWKMRARGEAWPDALHGFAELFDIALGDG